MAESEPRDWQLPSRWLSSKLLPMIEVRIVTSGIPPATAGLSLKIIAIAPLDRSSSAHILTLVSELHADLIVLPGYWHNTPSITRIRKALPKGAWVFLESREKLHSLPVLISSSAIVKLPQQVFGTSPTKQQLFDLESCFAHRTVQIGEQCVSFILCGEINAFQTDGATKSGINLPFEILINPAHFVMGRWHILGRKLSTLSHRGVVVNVANNHKNSDRLTIDVRIYAGGRQVGERNQNEFAAWCTYDAPTASQ